MAYYLDKSDGNPLEKLDVLNDGQIDTAATSITFVGKNVSNFGEITQISYPEFAG